MPAFPWNSYMQYPFSALISLQNVMFDNFKTNLKTGKSITIDGDT